MPEKYDPQLDATFMQLIEWVHRFVNNVAVDFDDPDKEMEEANQLRKELRMIFRSDPQAPATIDFIGQMLQALAMQEFAIMQMGEES